MAKGSFNGLYTFQDVANIYNIDTSTIRKQVQNHKFLDSEIRKFGKTWIITEQAMVEHFGKELFIAYKNNLLEQKALEIKRIKEEAKRAKEAEKEAKLNALAEAMLKSILEYVKISAPEVADLLDSEAALDASEVRKTLDSVIPMVAAAARIAVAPTKKGDGADSADDAINAFLDAFIN